MKPTPRAFTVRPTRLTVSNLKSCLVVQQILDAKQDEILERVHEEMMRHFFYGDATTEPKGLFS